jgi:hypothetical protein
MAFFFKTATQRRVEDFKAFFSELATATRTKQEAIAYALGVNQSSVAQWMNPEGDRHFPAALIPELPGEMAAETLRYLTRQIGVRDKKELNGMIEDEVVDLDEATGRFIQLYRNPKSTKTEMIAEANKMKLIIDRAIAEVEHK